MFVTKDAGFKNTRTDTWWAKFLDTYAAQLAQSETIEPLLLSLRASNVLVCIEINRF